MKMNDIRSKLADNLEMPDSIVSNNFDIRIQGNKRVIIDNHVGVLTYEDNNIAIKTKIGIITVIGNKMCIVEISDFSIIIEGIIEEIKIK